MLYIYYRMEPDSIYKYVGLIIISLFVLYIVLRSLNFQAKIIEGMATAANPTSTDKDKIADAVSGNTTTAEDTLLINKYNKTYEDIIINLENNINFYILGGIVNNAEIISKNPYDPAAVTTINAINSLKVFKDTLNDSMAFLDKASQN